MYRSEVVPTASRRLVVGIPVSLLLAAVLWNGRSLSRAAASAPPVVNQFSLSMVLSDGSSSDMTDEHSVRFRIDSTMPSAWVNLLMHAYVEEPDPSNPYAVDISAYIVEHPWMQRMDHPVGSFPIPNAVPWTHDRLHVLPELAAKWVTNCIGDGQAASPPAVDNVRAFCQPVTLPQANGSTPFFWSSQPANWTSNLPGCQLPHGGLNLARSWTKRVDWNEVGVNPPVDLLETFDSERLMQQAVIAEVLAWFEECGQPSMAQPVIDSFFDADLGVLLAMGATVAVDVQAIGLVDPQAWNVGANFWTEITTLPSLPVGDPFVLLSDVAVARIGLSEASPITHGGPGHESAGMPIEPVVVVGPGGTITAPISGIVPPLTCIIKVGNRQTQLPGSFAGVGFVSFPTPSGLTEGAVVKIVSVTNPHGTTVVTSPGWDHVVALDEAPYDLPYF